MLRIIVCLVAVLVLAEAPSVAFAHNTGPMSNPAAAATATAAKPSRIKLTVERLNEMKAKWLLNRPRMKACRAEIKSKGFVGDDRWFYMEDCMGKT